MLWVIVLHARKHKTSRHYCVTISGGTQVSVTNFLAIQYYERRRTDGTLLSTANLLRAQRALSNVGGLCGSERRFLHTGKHSSDTEIRALKGHELPQDVSGECVGLEKGPDLPRQTTRGGGV